MELERPELFDRRTAVQFAVAICCIALVSLFFEYRDYRELTRFDTAPLEAEVQLQYLKSKNGKRYTVLKLQSSKGATFYTTASRHLRDLTGYRLLLKVYPQRLAFGEYLGGFFLYSRIEKVYPRRTARIRLANRIASTFSDPLEGQIYAALFTASPMDKKLRERLSALGVSHLMAISGFHLGILALLVAAALAWPLRWLQSRYFPYRNRHRDLFMITLPLLFTYLWFLDFVPSLTRAFAMLAVGYLLYDRGIKVVSMQTLAVTVTLLLAFFPRLFFSIGFWLSVAGVFYILLFLMRFARLPAVWQFVGVHFWVYLMMLPVALFLFGTFSLWHPLSVVWSMLFILFYPAVLLAHLTGLENLLEGILKPLIDGVIVSHVSLGWEWFALQSAAALAALKWKRALWLLVGVSGAVLGSAIYQVA